MKRVLRLVVVIAATALLSGAAQAWETIAPEGAGFSIEMPSEPMEGLQEMESASGTIEITMYLAPTEGGAQAMFMMGYGTLPEDFDPQAELEAISENFTGGEEVVIQEDALEFDNGIGNEISVDSTEGDFFGRMRVYIIDQQVILMGVGGPAVSMPDEEVLDHYFDSFEYEAAGAAP